MSLLTPESRTKLKKLLMTDEQYRKFLYLDSKGHGTIGFGHDQDANGMSLNIALATLDEDMQKAEIDAMKALPNYSDLSDNRKIVVISMIFNLGLDGFLTFHEMISAMISGNDDEVVKQMLQSKWHNEIGDRAVRLAQMWQEG